MNSLELPKLTIFKIPRELLSSGKPMLEITRDLEAELVNSLIRERLLSTEKLLRLPRLSMMLLRRDQLTLVRNQLNLLTLD